MFQPAFLAGRRYRLRSLVRVDLVETQRRHARTRRLAAEGLLELAHRGQVGELFRIVDEVVERDQRMRLAAAVRERELTHRFLVLAGEPQHDFFGELRRFRWDK